MPDPEPEVVEEAGNVARGPNLRGRWAKPVLEEDLVEEDLLVEDVSIDGMCGVY